MNCYGMYFERAQTRVEVEAWLHSLWRSARNPNGFAPKTVRVTYEVMRVMF